MVSCTSTVLPTVPPWLISARTRGAWRIGARSAMWIATSPATAA
ncbi:hypothetical protein HMPREF0043_00990 [Actinobaculum sp. oral taxon 183 str. F0552]|nr:hypothetical protein HMPREF0043_00990 [Actinobaculum sp. oral taxon 183 str. F0552]